MEVLHEYQIKKVIMNKRQRKIRDFFDQAALEYDRDRSSKGGRIFNELIEIPATIGLVGNVEKNKKILDIGCGIGSYSKFYGEKLANVTGIDISEKMLEISKYKCRHCPNASFKNTSFKNFTPNKKFDIIIGAFMLGYFDDLEFTFQKINSVLNKKGIAVFSMLHPVRLSTIKRTLFSYEIGNYFDEKYYKTDLNMKFGELKLRKWNIEDVFNAIKKTNLIVSDIREPIPIKTKSKKFKKEELLFYKSNPSVIVFKFEKR